MSTPPFSMPVSLANLTYEQIAKTIDHSLLRPELTDAEMIAGCELAREYHVASVCIKPSSVYLAVRILRETDVHVGTVIGFPHGSSTTQTKVFEARQALDEGAVELDMVINIGWLRSHQDERVQDDISAVCAEAHGKALVKVILENAYLTDDEKSRGCQLVEAAGANFVKTSTGFAPSGATLDDLRLMRAHVSSKVQVKAAGGIRTLDALIDVLNTGTTRVGATATKTILDDFQTRKQNMG
jgi:deoxyribose-phosphate aldolase